MFALMIQNAQAIIDLNIAVQERDKSIATKDAQYVSFCFIFCCLSTQHIAEYYCIHNVPSFQ